MGLERNQLHEYPKFKDLGLRTDPPKGYNDAGVILLSVVCVLIFPSELNGINSWTKENWNT